MVKCAFLGVALLCAFLSSCFKKPGINQHALIQQKACVEALQNNDLARSRTHCELCLEYDKAMPECLNGIGLIAFLEHNEDKARDYFRKALRQNNDFSQARNNLGVLHFTNGEFKEARTYFARSLEIDPSNLDARYNLGLCELRIFQRLNADEKSASGLKHLIESEEQIRKLLAIEPNYKSAYRDLGLVYFYRQQQASLEHERVLYLAKSKKAFEECAQKSEQDGDCFEGLGQVLLAEHRYQDAYEQFFKCLGYDQANSACRNGIVVAYELGTKHLKGFKEFSQRVKNESKPEAHQAFCLALFDSGFLEEAVKECEHTLRIKPDSCLAHYRLGKHYADATHFDLATRYCKSFLRCEGEPKKLEHEAQCRQIITDQKNYLGVKNGDHPHH
jgi:tetratricopeptide (TPR) repeat protein